MQPCLIGYYRVSTAKQGGSGLGLDAQREAVRQYANRIGGELIEEHVEVESGKIARRPVLDAAIMECRRQKAVLVIARLDRLARNVAFVSNLMNSGIEFVACDLPMADRFIIHILAAVAEKERELISQRTKAALAAAKARGIKLGTFGSVLAQRRKAEAISWAERLREPLETSVAQGNRTLSAHAIFLNQAGYRSREGGRFCATSVARTLKHLSLSRNQGAMAALGP